MAAHQLWNALGSGLSLFRLGRGGRSQQEQEQRDESDHQDGQLHSDSAELQRRVLGHLEVTVVQTNALQGRPGLVEPGIPQQQHKTFEFTVHEGPEEVLKLFMHVFGRTSSGRREKHMATALVPINRAICTGADSRLVQLIVQPGNRPVAVIQVLLAFRRDGQPPFRRWTGGSSEDLPCLVYSAGQDFAPLLAIPDKFQEATAEERGDTGGRREAEPSTTGAVRL